MRVHLIAIAFLVAAATPTVLARQSQQPEPSAASCPAEYVIGTEDVLDIAVWGNADITRTVPVRPDGKISLPLLNDVQAAGFTPMQLRDRLAAALTTFIPAPAVSVIVREVHSFKVTVIGKVKAAGRYEVKDRPTVLDVLALAGGLTEFASRSHVVVLRQEGAKTRQIPFPYDKVGRNPRDAADGSAGGQDNFCVRPGDVVLVP